MSTDVDGAQPSARPGSDPAEASAGRLPPPDAPPRDAPVPTARAPSHPAPVGLSGAAADAAQSDVEPDTDAVDLHRELRRRAAAGGGGQPDGGRHARQDGNDKPPPRDYVPRHAMSTPGPGTLPPVGFARVAPQPALDQPAFDQPQFDPLPAVDPAVADHSGPPAKRVRVVLAERKRPIHSVGTVAHMRDLDDVGELLSTNLIKSQLGLAVRFGAVAAIVLGLLPVAFAAFPSLARVEILGIRLPWLALGILSYPLLVALGWLYTRATERLELSFTEHLRD